MSKQLKIKEASEMIREMQSLVRSEVGFAFVLAGLLMSVAVFVIVVWMRRVR